MISFCVILLMIMLGYFRPLKSKYDTLHALFDEIVILAIMDLLIFSSDPALDPLNRLELGWGIIGLLTFSIIWT